MSAVLQGPGSNPTSPTPATPKARQSNNTSASNSNSKGSIGSGGKLFQFRSLDHNIKKTCSSNIPNPIRPFGFGRDEDSSTNEEAITFDKENMDVNLDASDREHQEIGDGKIKSSNTAVLDHSKVENKDAEVQTKNDDKVISIKQAASREKVAQMQKDARQKHQDKIQALLKKYMPAPLLEPHPSIPPTNRSSASSMLEHEIRHATKILRLTTYLNHILHSSDRRAFEEQYRRAEKTWEQNSEISQLMHDLSCDLLEEHQVEEKRKKMEEKYAEKKKASGVAKTG